MRKKIKVTLLIIFLSISILISLGFNIIIYLYLFPPQNFPRPGIGFFVAIKSGPQELDPLNAYDSASVMVIEQVTEPLFFYNYSDPNLPLINWLCESYTWIDNVTLEIHIRQGIRFHDGIILDAGACVWNIERLLYLCNHTNELSSSAYQANVHSLYEFPNGFPIINNTQYIDSFTFRIMLNRPFGPFLSLLVHHFL